MDDLIQVQSMVETYTAEFDAIEDDFLDIVKALETINGYLGNPKNWSGRAHDQAAEIQEVVQAYTQQLAPMFASYRTCIKDLVNNADQFASSSHNVDKLRRW